jgi:hypothetical protein
LQQKAQLYFAKALKIYFQKARQSIIENAKHFAKTDKSLLGHPKRHNAVMPDKATLKQKKT